jgi:hypothetical protein
MGHALQYSVHVVCLDAPGFHRVDGWADFRLGQTVGDTLLYQGSVVDTFIEACCIKVPVCHGCPASPNLIKPNRPITPNIGLPSATGLGRSLPSRCSLKP